jgi:tRNA (guanine-N7-)-methyltransferase
MTVPARLLRPPAMSDGRSGDAPVVGSDSPAPPAAGPLRKIRSFAMRRGHVTNAQKRAYDELFPRYAVPYGNEPLDLAAAFDRAAPVVLEIGFGMGETTALIAHAHPEIDFLCVEVFAAGIGALARRLAAQGSGNVRIIQHDAVEVVRTMLGAESLAGVHIFFPDPWPKARHHKRRLLQPLFVHELAQRVAPGGYLHCATDWQHYAEQMAAVLSAEPLLRNRHAQFAPGPANPLCQRPITRFHARGELLGHGVWDLVFLRP